MWTQHVMLIVCLGFFLVEPVWWNFQAKLVRFGHIVLSLSLFGTVCYVNRIYCLQACQTQPLSLQEWQAEGTSVTRSRFSDSEKWLWFSPLLSWRVGILICKDSTKALIVFVFMAEVGWGYSYAHMHVGDMGVENYDIYVILFYIAAWVQLTSPTILFPLGSQCTEPIHQEVVKDSKERLQRSPVD